MPRYYFEANRDALRMRAELLPYIYTAAREAHDTGLGLIRPMYYEYSEIDEAYPKNMDQNLGQDETTRQFFFGNDLLLAPVTGPSTCAQENSGTTLEQPCSLTNQTVWLPPGSWFEIRSGKMRSGDETKGTTFEKGFMLSEVPIFARSGSIIPRWPVSGNDVIGRASRQYDHLEFTMIPGSETSGSVDVYEDDGTTYAYFQDNGYAWTTASYKKDAAKMTVTISTTKDRHEEMPSSRRYSIRLPNTLPPSSVKITSPSSADVPFSRWGGDMTWSFDGDEIAVVIDLGDSIDTTQSVVVEIDQTSQDDASKLDGLRGSIEKALWAKRNLDETRSAPGAHVPDPAGAPLVKLASMSDGLAVNNPKTFSDFIDSYPQLLGDALKELNSASEDQRMKYSIELLRSASA